MDDPEFIGAAGLVGRKNAHLIKSAAIPDGENISFSYELDSNGNPTKVTMSSKYETTAYKILYK